MEVTVLPKIAVNDELPWTPKLSVQSLDFRKNVWTTKSVICLSLSLVIVVLVGVLIGALLVSLDSSKNGKYNVQPTKNQT